MSHYFEISGAPFALGLVALFCACLAILFLLFVHDTEEDTWVVRAYLRYHLSQLRLNQLLKVLGLAPKQYVRTTPIPVLRQQLLNCRNCAFTYLCTHTLSTGQPVANELGFCPNLQSIRDQQTATQPA